MTECPDCGGTGFVIVEGPRGDGARKCACRDTLDSWTVQRLAKLKSGHKITLQAAKILADALGAIPWFPARKTERLAVASQLCRMCETYEEGRYIVQRAVNLCKDWNKCGGVLLLRQILCTVTTPKDGEVLGPVSKAFPNGIPSDVPERYRTLPPGQFRELPRGDVRLLAAGAISGDVDVQREVIAAAQTREMIRKPFVVQPPLRKPEPMSDARREEIGKQMAEAEMEFRLKKTAGGA